MLKNYIKIAFRFLFKNKTYSFINIFGLALGTLCCIYILLYVHDQYSYDKHHVDDADIYRIDSHLASNGEEGNFAITAAPIAVGMKRDFPEVKQFTRVVPLFGIDKHLLKYKEQNIWETDAYCVDSTFFDVFTYRTVNGNLKSALDKPYSVVLLKPTADKLFGTQDPVGKTITIDNVHGKHDYTVTGVAESVGKSHLHANIFITMKSGGLAEHVANSSEWTSNAYIGSYLKLQPNTNLALLEKKFPAFINRYAGEELKKFGIQEQLYLQPINTIHTTD